MLEKPYAGWTNIKIKNWSDRASYLSDIHLDLLGALVDSYVTSSYRPACVHYDAEGWEGIIVIDDYFTYIILDDTEENDKKFKSKVITFEIDKDDLAKELIKDIEKNLEEWSLWNVDLYDNKLSQQEENKKIIQNLLNKLKNIIERRG